MSLITITAMGSQGLRRTLLTALISVGLISSAQACLTDCSIGVYFSGVYTDETCNVVVNNGSSHEAVTLPRISISSLKKNGNEVGLVPFDITLKDCPTNRVVSVFFNSSASARDGETGNLLNDAGINHSFNVQVRLRKENGAQVIIDDATSGQDYIISSTGDPLSHRFTASYYAKGDSAVTAGLVHTIAGVELNYK